MEEKIITFSEELKGLIKKHPEINWNAVFRKAIINALNRKELKEFMDEKLKNSKFTEEDANRLGELVKEKRVKFLKSKGII